MRKLKENVWHLIVKMKKISTFLMFVFLLSCTSNTIFEKPKDLIPKDTMSLLIEDLLLANAAKYIKNKNLENQINYVPLVYNKYKIDSIRFTSSSFYYASVIDTYKEIIEDAKNSLEKKKRYYTKLKTQLDSIRRDSISKSKKNLTKLETIKDSNLE